MGIGKNEIIGEDTGPVAQVFLEFGIFFFALNLLS